MAYRASAVLFPEAEWNLLSLSRGSTITKIAPLQDFSLHG